IEALGAHVVVERGERDKLPLAALDHDERRADAVGSVAAEQVAAAERIAEQHLVVPVVSRLGAAARQLAARHAPNHGRHRLDALCQLRRHVPLDELAALAELRAHATWRRLLAPGPHQPDAVHIDPRVAAVGGHATRVEPIGILAREQEEAEPVTLELDRRLTASGYHRIRCSSCSTTTTRSPTTSSSCSASWAPNQSCIATTPSQWIRCLPSSRQRPSCRPAPARPPTQASSCRWYAHSRAACRCSVCAWAIRRSARRSAAGWCGPTA